MTDEIIMGYVEPFAALLTGVLVAFFLTDVVRTARRLVRERAGALLCRAPLRRPTRTQVLCWLALVALTPSVAAFFWTRTIDSQDAPPILAFYGFVVVWLIARGQHSARDLEVWESGCLLPKAARLLAWDRLRYCHWVRPPGRLYFVRRFTKSLVEVDAARKETVTLALSPRTELHNEDGDVVKPSVECTLERPREPRVRRLPLQFDLQTLLLLTVVVAAASAWGGAHVHALRRQEAGLRNLEGIHPSVTRRGNWVIRLHFDQSVRKPTDDDLRYIAKLRYLEALDLSDAPVTDAGLAHLHSLSSLRYLTIVNIRATDAGLLRLASIKSLRLLRVVRMQRGKASDMTPFTPEGCRQLGRLRPDLIIL